MKTVPLVLFVFSFALLAPVSNSRSGVSDSDAGLSTTARPMAEPCATAYDARPLFGGQAGLSGFDLSNLDRSVNPCDNFFEFADGGWVRKNPIPSAYPAWGTFNALTDRNQDVLRQILEEAASHRGAEGSIEQKIGDYYASCIDTDAIENAGIEPLEAALKRIDAVRNVAELEAEIAHLHADGADVAFRFGSNPDFKNSRMVIGQAGQGGLGLPDRDYYTNTDSKSEELRDQYVAHVQKMFELTGDEESRAAMEAKAVMALEEKLARASMTRVERRDPEKTYHKMGLAELDELTPDFSWKAYFVDAGFPGIEVVNVGQPDFFKTFNEELRATPLDNWKTYLRWHLLDATAQALPERFVDEDFNFNGKALTGAQELQPRWRRCVRSTDRQLGEALGQIYVKQAFPPEAKASALAMVHNLMGALRQDLTTLDWISPATKKEALAKLDAIALKIGYPDKWRDYSAYHVERAAYAVNFLHGNEFESHYRLEKIGKPTDRAEWGMTPPTVNAYYNAARNEIVFPAGILQPPFYDPHRNDALNYGGIGAVIGHEMTHGFDDQGSKFDADGNLRNWWTPEDLKNFQQRAECIVKQFDAYEVQPGIHENGRLVQGESIADFGGLTIAHMAWKNSLRGKSEPSDVNGFTPDQLFFLAWAQIWAGSERPEFERLQVKTNPHPLGRFRVNGPLSNMPAFEEAWGCGEGSSMIRPAGERCRIW
jgi:putative endopeptidase